MEELIKIDPEFKALIPPLSPDEYEQLRLNLIQDGCRDAICVWGEEGDDCIIIDGHNRFEICNRYNITYTIEHFSFNDREEVKDWIDTNQLGRRNLTPDQRRIIIGRRYNREKKQGARTDLTLDKICTKLKTADKLAGEYNHHPNTIKNFAKDAEFFENLTAKNPELAKEVWGGETTLKDVKKEEKIEQRKAQIEEVKKKIETENLTIEGLFDVIVIDPPWAYGREYDPQTSRVANPYPEMQVSEIEKIELPIKENSVVFLWTTHAFISDAFYLLDKWDLNYKAIIVWDKEQMGMGSTIRMQCEFCLLALKGKPIIQGASERDIIRESRREHSRKPEAFYQMVERMTIGRKLDYFARSKRDGWEVYGAETEKF